MVIKTIFRGGTKCYIPLHRVQGHDIALPMPGRTSTPSIVVAVAEEEKICLRATGFEPMTFGTGIQCSAN
jgi:hypothetical protein